MSAPESLVGWLSGYQYFDRNEKLPPGLVIQYHSRSDEHSKQLGLLVVEDLLDASEVLSKQAADGRIAFGINYRFTWPNGKTKTLDLVVGLLKSPLGPPSGQSRIHQVRSNGSPLQRLFIACEEKSVMTEHGKSQPRVFSELNDSHTIVHQGSRDTIAAGITMLNIAESFVSPLRQRPEKPVEVTQHDQPRVTKSMIEHLRHLPIRDRVEEVGFDSYCTFVVDLNNQGHVALWTEPPAPQAGEADEYHEFIARIVSVYEERYSDLEDLPLEQGLTIEDMLVQIATSHPGSLRSVGEAALAAEISGAEDVAAVLDSIEVRVNPSPEEA